MIAAGRLNQRVIVQSPGGSRDAYGERSTTWSDVATVWAALEPMSQREITAGGQEQTGATWRVIVREMSELAALAADWRVKLGSRVFVLVAPPVPLMSRGIMQAGFLELRCSEGLRQE